MTADFPRPSGFRPMIPTRATIVPRGPNWIHEIKHDGHRGFLFVDRGDVRIASRGGHDVTRRFTQRLWALSRLSRRRFIVDAELAAHGPDGVTRLELLEKPDATFVCYAFDLLYLDGRDLRELPLLDRKARLTKLFEPLERTAIMVSGHIADDGSALFAKLSKIGAEGVVSKIGTSPYTAGRTRAWLKTKCPGWLEAFRARAPKIWPNRTGTRLR